MNSAPPLIQPYSVERFNRNRPCVDCDTKGIVPNPEQSKSIHSPRFICCDNCDGWGYLPALPMGTK